MQDSLQVDCKSLQGLKALGCCLQHLILMDEDPAVATLYQRPQALAHTPPDIAQNLKSVHAGHQERDASVTEHTDGFGKPVKGLKIEAGDVELLELLGRIGHKAGRF